MILVDYWRNWSKIEVAKANSLLALVYIAHSFITITSKSIKIPC